VACPASPSPSAARDELTVPSQDRGRCDEQPEAPAGRCSSRVGLRREAADADAGDLLTRLDRAV
jgi:hypothetical protein